MRERLPEEAIAREVEVRSRIDNCSAQIFELPPSSAKGTVGSNLASPTRGPPLSALVGPSHAVQLGTASNVDFPTSNRFES